MPHIETCKDCCNDIKSEVPTIQAEGMPQKLKRMAIRLQPIVDLVCRVALALFAAILNIKLFIAFTGIGVGLGLGYIAYKKILNEKIEIGFARPTCAQGFFDYLSGMRCPPLLSTVVTAVFIGGHMHCSPFYIGFCSIPFGMNLTLIAWNLGYRAMYPLEASKMKSLKEIFLPTPTPISV